MKILCCGFFPALQRTLHFKNLQCSEVNRADSVSTTVGGKASNAARAIKILGGNPLLLSFIGGYTGIAVKNILNNEDIKYEFIETDVETRICHTLLTDNNPDFTELIEDIPGLPAKDWKMFVQTFTGLADKYDRIIFSGTIRKNAPEDIYAELIASTLAEKTIIDTSGAPLLAALEQKPALVKINTSELRKTLQEDGDTVELARELIARGAGSVGITEGGSQAVLVTPNTTVHYKIPKVKVVNTLGCGDSVNAGTAYMLAAGKTLPEAFAFGLACGTSNATTSLPGMIDINNLHDLASKIQIEQIY